MATSGRPCGLWHRPRIVGNERAFLCACREHSGEPRTVRAVGVEEGMRCRGRVSISGCCLYASCQFAKEGPNPMKPTTGPGL
jgi:hypothetical protein